MIDFLKYLHDKDIAHRDLKLDNMLVDEFLNFKVADFGYASAKAGDMLDTEFGTNCYIAPEVREKKPYDGKKADIFSTAVILYAVVRGNFPFINAK